MRKNSCLLFLVFLMFISSCSKQPKEDSELIKNVGQEKYTAITDYVRHENWEEIEKILNTESDQEKLVNDYLSFTEYYQVKKHYHISLKFTSLALDNEIISKNPDYVYKLTYLQEKILQEQEKEKEFVLSWTQGISYLVQKWMKK